MLYLTKENFEKETKEGITAVDFYADWCMPCKMMGPIFEGLDKEFEGKIKLAKLNTETESELATKFNITGIPCILILKDGKEEGRIVGMLPEDTLREKLNSYV